MQQHVKALAPAEAAAVFSYLASGGTICVYKPGARALPPSYSDKNPKPPRVYCVHAPESVYQPGV